MLAVHRGTADAAGIDWKSAVYRKVGEEMICGGGLAVGRMAKLGGVSQRGFYRFRARPEIAPDQDMNLRDSGDTRILMGSAQRKYSLQCA